MLTYTAVFTDCVCVYRNVNKFCRMCTIYNLKYDGQDFK